MKYEIETKKKVDKNEVKMNDKVINDNGYNNADMANTAIDEQERMRVLRDIKAMIERDTGESSETETKTLNTMNNSMEGMNNSDANMATTNEEEQIRMAIEKTEED